MTIMKETCVDLQEKYGKVKKLIEEDSKYDPENEPYRSKYSARQLLIGMKANIVNLLHSEPPNTYEHLRLTSMLGSVVLYLGIVSVDTEELSDGEKHFTDCQDIIKTHEQNPEFIIITLNMLNHLGFLWAKRDPEISKEYLQKAEASYKEFKGIGATPVEVSDLFIANADDRDAEKARRSFEKLHTLTLYYLAQIFGTLKDALKSSVYCHITLKRQLEYNDYEPIDWALNSATLSQFFMEKSGFKQARHHLAAASYVLAKYEDQLVDIVQRNEEYDAKVEDFKHRSADVARCWVKYGLLLLSSSKERLINHTDDIDTNCTLSPDLAKLQLNCDSTVSSEDLSCLQFTSLDLSNYEAQITDHFVLTFDDARAVFANIQDWLKEAQKYYTLSNLASDYIETVQDQSQMYNHLLFFEDGPENQAKMHKRRADLLENVLKEINPTYYIQYCRQMYFELGQIYCDILDIKLDKLNESKERPSAVALSKINALAEKGITQYTNFVNSFKDISTNELPKTIIKDMEKPFLLAYFHIAALHNRIITLDKQIQLEHVRTSLETYKRIISYCEDNPGSEELITTEINLCREMISLLPFKIAKLS